MTKKIRAAVVGYGNIGKFTVEALEAAADFEIAGIVRRNGAEDKPKELADYEQQGRKAIVEATKQMDIDENVRQHAANTIIPMIVAMGFRQEDITVTFRKPGNSAITTILK